MRRAGSESACMELAAIGKPSMHAHFMIIRDKSSVIALVNLVGFNTPDSL